MKLFKSLLIFFFLFSGLCAIAQIDAIKISSAKKAFENKEYQIALEALNEVSSKGRTGKLFLYYKGYSHYGLDQFDSAEVYLKKYLLSDMTNEEAAGTLGDIDYKKKKFAIEEMQKNELLLKQEQDRIDSQERMEKATKEQEELDRKQREAAAKYREEQARYREEQAVAEAKRKEEEAKREEERRRLREERENRDIDISGLEIGYFRLENPENAPCELGINVEFFLGDAIGQLERVGWEFGLGMSFGTKGSPTGIANAFNMPVDSFSSFGNGGFCIEAKYGLNFYFINKRSFKWSFGPRVGIALIEFPYLEGKNYKSYSLSSSQWGGLWQLGGKTDIFLGTKIFLRLEYLYSSTFITTPIVNYNGISKELPSLTFDYTQFRLGVGFRF